MSDLHEVAAAIIRLQRRKARLRAELAATSAALTKARRVRRDAIAETVRNHPEMAYVQVAAMFGVGESFVRKVGT